VCQRIRGLRWNFFQAINSFRGSRHNRRHNTRTTLIFKEFLRRYIPCTTALPLTPRSPVIGLVCHRRWHDIVANLMPASRHQDHATSLSAGAFVRRSTRHGRRIPRPTFRDDRDTPLQMGAGRQKT